MAVIRPVPEGQLPWRQGSDDTSSIIDCLGNLIGEMDTEKMAWTVVECVNWVWEISNSDDPEQPDRGEDQHPGENDQTHEGKHPPQT